MHAELAGRERVYRGDVDALGEVEDWIAALRTRWDQHLDALDTEGHRTRREREHRESRATKVTDAAVTTQEKSA